MKFDIKKLKKYYNRPSFNFLAYQGLVLATLMVTCAISCFAVYCIYDINELIEGGLCGFLMGMFIYLVIIFPFTNLFSFLSYTFYKTIKCGNFLFNPIHLIITSALFSTLLITERVDSIGTSGEGSIVWGAIFMFPFILPTTILFTLLPYLAIRHKEKKHNLTIDNPPFTRNKYLHYATLIGTALYILINLVFLYITATYILNLL